MNSLYFGVSKIAKWLQLRIVIGIFYTGFMNEIGDSIPIFDALGEMKREFNPNMQLYYNQVGLQLYKDGKLSREWKAFRVDKKDVLRGEWSFGKQPFLSTAWWLNGAHSVDANVAFQARCVDGWVEIRKIKGIWTWNDEIDAAGVNQWWKEKETWAGVLVGLPNLFVESLLWDKLMDGVLNTNFDVQIRWLDNAPNIRFPTYRK